jgi:kynurenine 3-monooxygenase
VVLVVIKTRRLDFSQQYIQHGYKEFCIAADESGKWKMELNYLHIWPRHRFMLIALPNPVTWPNLLNLK